MIDWIQHAFDVFVGIVGPIRLKAFLIALALSVGSTQFIKGLPGVAHHKARRVLLTRSWAVLSAAVSVALLYPAPPIELGLTAAAAGFCAPLVYAAGVRMIGLKWPALREALSGDDDADR